MERRVPHADKPLTTDLTIPDKPELSVVAPLYNESQNVRPLVEWILQALESYTGRFEIILVDDGSRDVRATLVLSDSGWDAMWDRPQQ